MKYLTGISSIITIGKPIAAIVYNELCSLATIVYPSPSPFARLTWVIANVAPKPINSTNVNRAMRDLRTLFNGSVGDFDAGSLMR